MLGGDTPFGLPLILDLEKKGYIVVTSVATSEAIDALERKCHGYVRALVLNPSQVSSKSKFDHYLLTDLFYSRILSLSSYGL